MITALILVAGYLLLPLPGVVQSRLPDGLGKRIDSSETRQNRRESSYVLAVKAWSKSLLKWASSMIGDGQIKACELLDAAAVLDILSSCLKSGLPAENALRAAAGGAPEHLRQPLLHCAAKLTVGTGNAWRGLAEVPVLDDLARAGERAEKSGTALADALGDVASSYRSRAGDAAEATAERAGVLIAGPLALCFLPAFVVLGLVPTIAGLAEDMFAGMVPG